MDAIDVARITRTDTLAGKSAGLEHLPKFLVAIDKTAERGTVVLDFSGIELVTASYFGATIAVLLRMAVSGELDRFYVLEGLNKNCLDELKLVMEYQGLTILVAESRKGKPLSKVSVVGKIDPVHLETFCAISETNGATANELRELADPKTRIGQTAWINRLNALHQARLVRKSRVGKEFLFQAIHQEK